MKKILGRVFYASKSSEDGYKDLLSYTFPIASLRFSKGTFINHFQKQNTLGGAESWIKKGILKKMEGREMKYIYNNNLSGSEAFS